MLLAWRHFKPRLGAKHEDNVPEKRGPFNALRRSHEEMAISDRYLIYLLCCEEW